LNQAVRDEKAILEKEFRIYDSSRIPRLLQVTSAPAPLPRICA